MFNLMDYSLLLCIEENQVTYGDTAITLNEKFRQKKLEKKLRHQFISECGKWIYHLSVIDYLQDFNIEKKIENFLKTKKATAHDAKLISAVHPDDYADRFIAFMKNHVIINQK